MESNPTVQIVIPTRGRYHQLPLTLWSVLRQTYKRWELLIIDDNDDDVRHDFRSDLPLKHLLVLIEQQCLSQGLGSFRIFPGERKGPHYAHQLSLHQSAYDLILRMDDDCVMSEDCLELLVEMLVDEEADGVAPIILQPDAFGAGFNKFVPSEIGKVGLDGKFIPDEGVGKIGPNGENDGIHQWFEHKDEVPFEVEHLYSSFLYKKSLALAVGGYCLDYSKVGHREETDLSFRMHLAGAKLLVNPATKMWHLKSPFGGIRTEMDPSLWIHDDALWQKRVRTLRNSDDILVKIDGGIGDHICATPMLRGVRKKWPGKKIRAAVCYPFALENNPNIDEIVPFETKSEGISLNSELYRWGLGQGYSDKLSKAWCYMYGVEWDGDNLDCYITEEIVVPDWISHNYMLISPYAGNSLTRDVLKDAPKCWLSNRWEELVKKIKELDIDVIQMGRSGELEIPGATFLPDKPFKSVAGFMKHDKCVGVVTTDNFVGHLAHALDIECIVLFFASDPDIFGHDESEKQIVIRADRKICKQQECHGRRMWDAESKNAQWLTHEPCNNRMCAESIGVDNVFDEVKRMLRNYIEND